MKSRVRAGRVDEISDLSSVAGAPCISIRLSNVYCLLTVLYITYLLLHIQLQKAKRRENEKENIIQKGGRKKTITWSLYASAVRWAVITLQYN